MERTVILLKPDAIHRNLIGTIIARIESRNLKIIALKMMQLGKSTLDDHYSHIYDERACSGDGGRVRWSGLKYPSALWRYESCRSWSRDDPCRVREQYPLQCDPCLRLCRISRK